MTVQTRPVFQPYLPRLVVEWQREHPDVRFAVVPGTLVSVDLSGFTSLSERLEAKGRMGAEELILLISGVFEGLIGIADRHGGDVLKFRGDALLLLLRGRRSRAARLPRGLRDAVADRGDGRDDELRRPGGAADGDRYLLRRLPLLPRRLDRTASSWSTGPAATEVVKLEDAAERGEVLVSAATAHALEPGWLVGERDGAVLLARVPAGCRSARRVETDAAERRPRAVRPQPLRRLLALGAGEGEHRTSRSRS